MTPTTTLEDLIKAVAVRHGVALGKDDPLLMLHTINEHLVKEGAAAQEKLLADFQRQLEAAMTRLGVDMTDKAERAIAAAVRAAREALTAQAEEVARRSAGDVEAVVRKVTAEHMAALNSTRPLVLAAVGAAVVSMAGALIAFLFVV